MWKELHEMKTNFRVYSFNSSIIVYTDHWLLIKQHKYWGQYVIADVSRSKLYKKKSLINR